MDALEELALAIARDELDIANGTSTIARLAGAIADRLGVYLKIDVPTDRAEDLVHSLCTGRTSLCSLGDGRVVDLALAVEGVALPHRLTGDEVEADRLDLYPDLAVLVEVAGVDGGLHDPIGTPLALRRTRDRTAGPDGSDLQTASLLGPEGWLRDLSPGSLVVVRATDGILHIESTADREATVADEVVALVGAAVDAHEDGQPADGTPRDLDAVQATALVDGWWAPEEALPFGEVLAASGLEVAGDQIGRPGSWARWVELGAMIGPIARNRTLSEPSLRVISDLCKAAADDPTGPIPPLPDRAVIALSEDPDLVERLLPEVRRIALARSDDPTGADALTDAWVSALPIRPGARGIGVDALRARWALIQGDIATATELAERVLRTEPHFYPPVELLAELAANAGDIRRTVSLLKRVRYLDDGELSALDAAVGSLTPNVGRNDPCPCGSGRKYKQCHLGRLEIPTTTTVTWLLDQARAYTRATAPPDAIRAMGEAVGPLDGLDGDLIRAVEDDLALFDHGWLARFREERAAVLSAEHRDLLDAWLTDAAPGVYQVADAGESTLGFIDTENRDWYEVGRSGSLDVVEDGMEVWARLVPAGDCWWTSGICVPVPAAADPEALRAARSSDEAGAWLRALLTPAPGGGARAADGTPRVRAWVKISFDEALGREALVAALDGAFERSDDELAASWCWDLPLTPAGTARVAVSALMFEAIFSENPELADAPEVAKARKPPKDLSVSAQSVAGHDQAVDRVVAVLAAAGASPSVGERTITPWARSRVLDDQADLLRAAEPDDDDWYDDWYDDEYDDE